MQRNRTFRLHLSQIACRALFHCFTNTKKVFGHSLCTTALPPRTVLALFSRFPHQPFAQSISQLQYPTFSSSFILSSLTMPVNSTALRALFWSVLYGVDKVPDSWFHAIPGGYYRPPDAKQKKKEQKELKSRRRHSTADRADRDDGGRRSRHHRDEDDYDDDEEYDDPRNKGRARSDEGRDRDRDRYDRHDDGYDYAQRGYDSRGYAPVSTVLSKYRTTWIHNTF